jgi:hypothetical protein
MTSGPIASRHIFYTVTVTEFTRKFLLIKVSSFKMHEIMSDGFRNGNGSRAQFVLSDFKRVFPEGLSRKCGHMTEEVKECLAELHNLYS